jgi:hypothetical protein
MPIVAIPFPGKENELLMSQAMSPSLAQAFSLNPSFPMMTPAGNPQDKPQHRSLLLLLLTGILANTAPSLPRAPDTQLDMHVTAHNKSQISVILRKTPPLSQGVPCLECSCMCWLGTSCQSPLQQEMQMLFGIPEMNRDLQR